MVSPENRVIGLAVILAFPAAYLSHWLLGVAEVGTETTVTISDGAFLAV